MTAPAILDAPIDSPDAMENVIATTLKESADIVGPPAETPRDPKTGKFLPKAEITPGDVPAEGAPIVPGDAPADAPIEPEAPVIPEGYVAAPVLPEERARAFKVRDAEGEIAAPDLTWSFTADGKPRELTTDKLIAYAQLGVYNHAREQRAQQLMQENQTQRVAMQRAEAQARELQIQYDALMQSDDAYLTARAQHEAQNTPEARLDRERQARSAAEEEVAVTHAIAAGERFFGGTVQPAVALIRNALPTVSDDEIGMRLLLLTEHLRVQTSAGLIYPPQVYPQLQRALIDEVVPWAQQVHESRAVERAKPTQDAAAQAKKAKQDADAAQVRAQKARRAATAAARPAAGNQSTGNGRPIPPVVRTNKDAEAAVIGGTLAAFRAG